MSAKTTSFLHSTFDKFIGSLSIRYILPLMMTVPLVVSVIAIGWLSFQSGKKEIDNLILKVGEKSTKIIEQSVDNYLENPEILLRSQLGTIQSESLSLDKLPKLQREFWQILQQKGSFDVVYAGNKQGNYVLVEKIGSQFITAVRNESTKGYRNFYELDSQGNRTKLIKSDIFDPRTRPWYEVAKNTGKPVWSHVYRFARTKRIGMTFAIPVYEQKSTSFQGVISTDFTLSKISDFLRNLEISPNGKAIILERTGNIIAQSTSEQPFNTVKEELKRLNITESQEPIIQATGQYLIKKFKSLDRIKNKQQLTFKFQGNSQFLQVTPVQNHEGIDWLMVVVVPESDFMKDINAYTRFNIIIGVSVAGIAVILALLLVRWITQPIQQLQQAAKMLESDEFDGAILLGVAARRDEFGQLGKVFLAMTNVIFSREQNWKQMIDSLQSNKHNQRKIQTLDTSQKQLEAIEELLKEAQNIRIRIGENSEKLLSSKNSSTTDKN